MKLYIWKHKNTAMRPENFYPLALVREVKPNGFYAVSCHAFFKRKDAFEFLKEIGWDESIRDMYELIAINL